MTATFRNPILSGFYPDPSICRVGQDYYLVTSTFEYFPGLPIFHSRDLVNWRQIGHALDRPSQLNLDGVMASRGLYAPTIRYHTPPSGGGGRFYITNTLVGSSYDTLLNDGVHERNFIVTAEDPAGPWSEPYWLEGAPGIDPSLFFDDAPSAGGDGRAWYTGNRVPPRGPDYPHHKEIWLQELDLDTMRLTGPQYALWDGALKGNLEAEAPHIYKKDGYYYLLVAEGGTEHHHAVTIARSRQIHGPYEGNPRNPLLTHRNLGFEYPIACTGHAELVETQNGEWWMALLATRPYGGYYYNLGRETFLVPVIWEHGWPIVTPGNGRVEFEHTAPDLPPHPWPPAPARDQFDDPRLAHTWNFIRTPREKFWSLSERPDYLRLRLRPQTLAERANPSFVGRRQQHINFSAAAAMEFQPANASECAGLVLLQNNDFHFRFVITRSVLTNSGGTKPVEGETPSTNSGGAEPVEASSHQGIIRLVKRAAGVDTVLAEQPISGSNFTLKVQAQGQTYSFYIAGEAEQWQAVAEGVDGRILSTNIAGGFVGAYIGMYASSNGQAGNNIADFDWFEYTFTD